MATVHTCDAAGCLSSDTVLTPMFPKPSPVAFDHPDYTPPTTQGWFCADHRKIMIWQSAVNEQVAIGGPTTERRGGDTPDT